MAPDAIDRLDAEVEPLAILLEPLHDAGALLVVAKEAQVVHAAVQTARHGMLERPLAAVAEGRVAQVVAEGNGLREILVEAERPCDVPRDLGDLKGVREARAVVIPLGCQKDLRLVGKAAEALAVQDAVAILLEAGAEQVGCLGACAPGALGRVARKRAQERALAPLQCHSVDDVHAHPPSS